MVDVKISKEEETAIAEEVLTLLKTKELPLWQCREILGLVKKYLLENTIVK